MSEETYGEVVGEQQRGWADESEALRKALDRMDWEQVLLNGGPPCFSLQGDGTFCGRAQRWAGHDRHHPFVSLSELVAAERETMNEASVRGYSRGFETGYATGTRHGFVSGVIAGVLLAVAVGVTAVLLVSLTGKGF